MNDWLISLPEVTLLTALCVVLLVDILLDDERREITVWLSLISVALTAWAVVAMPPDGRVFAYSGSYVADGLSQVLKLGIIVLVGVGFYYARDYLKQNDLLRGEYYLLGMFGLLGMLVMTSANSMLTMYLGLETLSLSLYAMVAFERKSVGAAEAAMKYFVLGAIASGALLYGISWVYGVTGELQFDRIAAALVANPDLNAAPLWFGLAFIVVGIAFKFGAVPFHMWLPDVYQGARSPVTLYIASAPKLAALAMLLRFLSDGMGDLHEVWQGMIMVVGVLSLVIGNVVAIAQTNIKRMLGYSAIAHVGFIMLSAFTGTETGYAAALFYSLTYVVMAAGAFGMVILLSRQGYEAELLSDFKGLNARSPWFALMMLFFMFGMAGVPPWVGFFAKLSAIGAVLDAGHTSLAILMVLASVIGAFYYLRVVWYMYFDAAEDRSVFQSRMDTRVLLSINGLAVLALGMFPGWLMAACVAAFV